MDKKTLDQYHNYEVKPDRSLAADLLAWYDQVKRNLPWRGDPDPYHIWVSEAMLQQTRVETAIPYYRRFLERFPTLDDLARASEEEVLRAWQGLGYYGRARNLWHCAREVEERHGGIFPATLAELRLLSGIGDYTAAALGSIAFRLVEPALDGNALRVASRWFDLDEEVDRPATRAKIRQLILAEIRHERPGDFNQAVMELGARVCLSAAPHCHECPVNIHCLARKRGSIPFRPVRKPRKPPRLVKVACGLAHRGGQTLLRRRPSKGLLAGMWEFPTTEVVGGDTPLESLQAFFFAWGMAIMPGKPWRKLEHVFTHLRWEMLVFRFTCPGSSETKLPSNLRWAAPEELEGLPMGCAHRRVADLLAGEPFLQPLRVQQWPQT